AVRPTALGVYIFAGGFTCGVSDHFDVAAQLEEGNFGAATTRANFPTLPVFTKREEWPSVDRLRELSPDLIYGNPPCAAWSAAGSTKGRGKDRWRTDPRVDFHRNMVKTCLDVSPTVWAFESVTQMLSHGKDLVDGFTETAQDAGYSVTTLLTDGLNHGLAQRRRRAFFVAHKVELDWGDPQPVWKTVGDVLQGVEPWDYPREHENAHRLLPRLKQGGRLRDIFDEEYPPGTKGRPSFILRRLRWDEPSRSIAGNADYIHPLEDRMLAPNELAALCGYPADYQWVGSLHGLYQQVGRAVLPNVASWLAGVVSHGVRRARSEVEPGMYHLDFLKRAEALHKERRVQ
ncbi:hypothetical protein LCGC14_2526410, partial [marine sediment metagenome]